MRKIIIVFILASLALTSCRVKDKCELNDLGNICITNNTNSDLEILIDNAVVFTLSPGEVKCSEQSVGEYTVKCMAYPEEWTYDVIVEQCEDREISVPE